MILFLSHIIGTGNITLIGTFNETEFIGSDIFDES